MESLRRSWLYRTFATLYIAGLLAMPGLLIGEPDSLVLHLPFDEEPGAQRFADASGHGHDAGCGGNIPCPRATGDAGFFELSSSHWEWLEVSDHPDLNPGKELTMSVWIRPGNALWQNGKPVRIGGGKILGKTTAKFNGGFLLGTDVKSQKDLSYQLYPEIWDSAGKQFVFRAGEFKFGQWTHLAVTWKSGGSMIGYVNGREVARIQASKLPIGNNNNPLRIGIAPWDTNALAFGGGIDDVRIYREALATTEIQSLYNFGRNGHDDSQNLPQFPEGPESPEVPANPN